MQTKPCAAHRALLACPQDISFPLAVELHLAKRGAEADRKAQDTEAERAQSAPEAPLEQQRELQGSMQGGAGSGDDGQDVSSGKQPTDGVSNGPVETAVMEEQMEGLRSYLTNKKLAHLVKLTEVPGWKAQRHQRGTKNRYDRYFWPPGAGKQFCSYLTVTGYLEDLHQKQEEQGTSPAGAGVLLPHAPLLRVCFPGCAAPGMVCAGSSGLL